VNTWIVIAIGGMIGGALGKWVYFPSPKSPVQDEELRLGALLVSMIVLGLLLFAVALLYGLARTTR
jgi:hypothetical protein